MKLFAQNGFQKMDRVEIALRQLTIQGVILSPRYETPASVSPYIANIRREFGAHVTILFDPQFYASTIVNGRLGKLPDYPYFQSGLNRASLSLPANVAKYVSDTIKYQLTLNVDYFISPSVLFGGFQDPWSQIALSMAQESQTFHGNIGRPKPLLISLIIDEAAFRTKKDVDDFLDIITTIEVDGFYLVVRRNDASYQASLEETSLANLLYFIYVLTEINGYEVVAGYADFVGLLLSAVGATACATGWFNRLRQFSLLSFEASTGGAPPRARYSSSPLLNSILVVPELNTIAQQRLMSHAFTGTSYDGAIAANPGNAPWPALDSSLHHWETLSKLVPSVSAGSVSQRLNALSSLVSAATAEYAILESAGVPFEARTGPAHLSIWQRAIQYFRTDAGV